MSSEARVNPDAGLAPSGKVHTTNETTTAKQKSQQQILKSIIEAKTPKIKLNEIEMESMDLAGAGPVGGAGAAVAATAAASNGNKLSEYYSNKKNAARSLSMDGEDDKFIDSILIAKDRRTSWQQVRSQKSFVPSLSAICKC
jgi:hypothetical protein